MQTAGRAAAGRRDFEEALRGLIRISRAIGSDPDLIQGGGGNTSVKTRDGRGILVKASGTSLAAMDGRKGWAELDLEAVRGILEVGNLSHLPEARREAEVLRLLAGTVRRPAGARPTVEANLHALLARVVIHTHAVGLNAFLCSRDSRARWERFLGSLRSDALYVPYTDPGYTLASRLEAEIGAYRARRGRPPAIVLLENHGVFAAADEADDALRLSKRVTDLGRKFIGGKRVNPVEFPAAVSGPAFETHEMEVRGALLRGGAAPVLVRKDRSPLAAAFIGDRKAVGAARRGAFTPDQIVYCRTYPLVLRPAPEEGRERRWEAAVREYRAARKTDPRVVIVPGDGVYYAAPDLAGLRIVSEAYRGAIAAMLGSSRAGGPRFLDRRRSSFIERWEVEAFRARVAAGSGAALKGRIAVVVGAAEPEGLAAARMLAAAGATVALVDRPGPGLDRAAAAIGKSGIPVPIGPAAASFLDVIGTIGASAGGCDILVDAWLRPAARWFFEGCGLRPWPWEESISIAGMIGMRQGRDVAVSLVGSAKKKVEILAGTCPTFVDVRDDARGLVDAALRRLESLSR